MEKLAVTHCMAQGSRAEGKSSAWFICFDIKPKLSCFYLRIKSNPQNQINLRPSSRWELQSKMSCWVIQGCSQPLICSCMSFGWLLGDFCQDLHTGAWLPQLLLLTKTRRLRPTNTVFPGLGLPRWGTQQWAWISKSAGVQQLSLNDSAL